MPKFCPIRITVGAPDTCAILCFSRPEIAIYSNALTLLQEVSETELMIDEAARVFKLRHIEFTSAFEEEIIDYFNGLPPRFGFNCNFGVTSRILEVDEHYLFIEGQEIRFETSRLALEQHGAEVSIESRGGFTKYIGSFVFEDTEFATEFCLAVKFSSFLSNVERQNTGRIASQSYGSPEKYKADTWRDNSSEVLAGEISPYANSQTHTHADIKDVMNDLDKALESLTQSVRLTDNVQTNDELQLSRGTPELAENSEEQAYKTPESVQQTPLVDKAAEGISFDKLLDSISKQKPLPLVLQRNAAAYTVKSSYQGLAASASQAMNKTVSCQLKEEPNEEERGKTARTVQKQSEISKQPLKKYFTEDELLDLFEEQGNEPAEFDEEEYYTYLTRFYIAIDKRNKPIQLKFKAFVDVLLFMLDEGGTAREYTVCEISRIRNIGANTLLRFDLQDEAGANVKKQVLLHRVVGDHLMRAFKLFVLNGTKTELRSVE